jgi:hypothetical protein
MTEAETTTQETKQDELGAVLWRGRTIRVCEKGISDGKKTILWDKVYRLFLDATKIKVRFLPATSLMSLRIFDQYSRKINLVVDTLPRKGADGRNDFMMLYKMVIARVMERQRAGLTSKLKEGRTVSFDIFDLTPNRIERKSILGSYTIALSHVTGCRFERGDFVIDFIDDTGHVKQQKLGKANRIPNVHLVQAFLQSIARNNLNR